MLLARLLEMFSECLYGLIADQAEDKQQRLEECRFFGHSVQIGSWLGL
jgi:hypothetical protein